MKEGSLPAPLGLKKRGFKAFLIFLYAVTFYLGPQFAGIDLEKKSPAGYSAEHSGPATGAYMINLFNRRFELNDL